MLRKKKQVVLQTLKSGRCVYANQGDDAKSATEQQC